MPATRSIHRGVAGLRTDKQVLSVVG